MSWGVVSLKSIMQWYVLGSGLIKEYYAVICLGCGLIKEYCAVICLGEWSH